jgi:hypothetical protein
MSGVLARIAGIAIADSALAVHARPRGVQRLPHPEISLDALKALHSEIAADQPVTGVAS